MSASLMATISGFRSPMVVPWNWMPWRVVIFSVPLAYCPAIRSSARYCAPVMIPPAARTRTMNCHSLSSPACLRTVAVSRLNCS